MVVRQLPNRPSSFDVPRHQKGGLAPSMPQRHASIVSHNSEEASVWELQGGETSTMGMMPPPPPPPMRRPGGETPQIPDRRRTVNLQNEKELLAVASASAEF